MSKKKEAVVEEWRRLIAECENRPKGVKFSDWCESVGVSKTNYYYWKKGLGELESDTPQIVKVEADTLVSEEGFMEKLNQEVVTFFANAFDINYHSDEEELKRLFDLSIILTESVKDNR